MMQYCDRLSQLSTGQELWWQQRYVLPSVPLPGHEHFPVKCTDTSTKSTRALRFASVSYSEWDGYEPRDDERGVFTEFKHAADAFMDRLLSVVLGVPFPSLFQFERSRQVKLHLSRR